MYKRQEYQRPKNRGEGMTTEKADATLTYSDGRPPVTKAKDVTAAVQEIIGLDYSQFCQIAMIAQGQFTKLLNASTEERSRIFRKLFRTQRYARLQERLQAESAALSQQRTTQNAKLDSLLSGIRFSPDDPDADALAALNAQTEPETALALLEGLLARQQAAQETVAAALKDTEAAYGEGNGAEVLRFFLLRSQYRSPISFSSALIEEAQKALVRLYGALKGREAAEGEVDWSEKYAAQFKAAMDDDFNTPLAIAAMFELATEINRTGDPVLVRQLKGLGAVLNILQLDPENFLKGGASDADEARINALIEERREAKKAKNFARADEIRKSLLDEGIVLMDGPQGTTWRRI